MVGGGKMNNISDIIGIALILLFVFGIPLWRAQREK